MGSTKKSLGLSIYMSHCTCFLVRRVLCMVSDHRSMYSIQSIYAVSFCNMYRSTFPLRYLSTDPFLIQQNSFTNIASSNHSQLYRCTVRRTTHRWLADVLSVFDDVESYPQGSYLQPLNHCIQVHHIVPIAQLVFLFRYHFQH